MILECKQIADNTLNNVKMKVEELKAKGIEPSLALVRVLGDDASAVYVGRKESACKECNLKTQTIELPNDVTMEEIQKIIYNLNRDRNINAIMLQLPLPEHLDERDLLGAIAPTKDADCLNYASIGLMMTNDDIVQPCTPKGVMKVLKENNIELEGKNVLVINRSLLVGKPLVELLQRENATVTLAHSRTRNLFNLIERSDVIITAVGKKNFITEEQINSLTELNKSLDRHQYIVDVSINVDEQGKLNGDVALNNKANRDFIDNLPNISITPVPGGIGLTTVACLLENTIELTELQLEMNNK